MNNSDKLKRKLEIICGEILIIFTFEIILFFALRNVMFGFISLVTLIPYFIVRLVLIPKIEIKNGEISLIQYAYELGFRVFTWLIISALIIAFYVGFGTLKYLIEIKSMKFIIPYISYIISMVLSIVVPFIIEKVSQIKELPKEQRGKKIKEDFNSSMSKIFPILFGFFMVFCAEMATKFIKINEWIAFAISFAIGMVVLSIIYKICNKRK